jgi:hypothetical protein
LLNVTEVLPSLRFSVGAAVIVALNIVAIRKSDAATRIFGVRNSLCMVIFLPPGIDWISVIHAIHQARFSYN